MITEITKLLSTALTRSWPGMSKQNSAPPYSFEHVLIQKSTGKKMVDIRSRMQGTTDQVGAFIQ